MEGRKYNLTAYRYAFNTQERVPELNESHYTALYWEYDGRLARRWNVDPVMKEHESVYAAFANNPVWFVDVLGNDTIDIEHNSESGKWNITNYQKVKGDDVFRIKIGDETKLYTFSEGEYGERVNALNLESNEDYTLGIYHISGSPEDKSGIGFYVTPGGDASTEKNSNKRLPEGEYDLIASPNIKTVKWEMPWVVSETNKKIASRGIKFHPAYSPSVTTWTKGCFVLFYDYDFDQNCKIKSTKESSVNAAFYFVHLLDAKIISDKKYGEYCRMTAIFTKKQLATLIIKSTWKQQ
ncbi:MAG: hypothetical protein KatS3mg035_2048 [Bacteroidia bacterium]|nr:MAG: hypothetical protein KatS3mg035_2048 [Bacteroidia bacterium]